MSSITVIGSANTDLIIKSDKIPHPGETVTGGEFFMVGGGKGANQAIASRRLGGDVVFMCCLGDDVYGEKQKKNLEDEGFDPRFIKVLKGEHSGIALIMIDGNAENCISVASGANSKLFPKLIDEINPFCPSTNILLIQLEVPIESVHHAVKKANKLGIKVILNAAPALEIEDRLLSIIDILVINETEAEMLTGGRVTNYENIEKAARILLGKGVRTVVITMGGEGSHVFSEEENFHIPAYTVEAVDTTAAGDTFCGALAYYLNEGKSLKAAVRYANAAAAICVTRLGAQQSIPNRVEVEKFYQERMDVVVH